MFGNHICQCLRPLNLVLNVDLTDGDVNVIFRNMYTTEPHNNFGAVQIFSMTCRTTSTCSNASLEHIQLLQQLQFNILRSLSNIQSVSIRGLI